MRHEVELQLLGSKFKINDEIIKESKSGTHVGIVRSSEGNSSHIMNRLSAHRRAVFSVLHSGIANHHNGNPYASLRVEKCFGEPDFDLIINQTNKL